MHCIWAEQCSMLQPSIHVYLYPVLPLPLPSLHCVLGLAGSPPLPSPSTCSSVSGVPSERASLACSPMSLPTRSHHHCIKHQLLLLRIHLRSSVFGSETSNTSRQPQNGGRRALGRRCSLDDTMMEGATRTTASVLSCRSRGPTLF
jgi:hypothetical protein